MVSNVTIEGPMTTQPDYRFTVTVTWKPPVYPNITPSKYLLRWSKEDNLDLSHSAVREITSCLLLSPFTPALKATSSFIFRHAIFRHAILTAERPFKSEAGNISDY